MGGLAKIVVSLAFLGMFALAVTNYVAMFGEDNNSAVRIDSDSRIQEFNSSIRGNLSSFRTSANESSVAQSEGGIQLGDSQTSESSNQFRVNTVDAFTIAVSTLSLAMSVIFGNDSAFGIIASTLIGLLVVLVGFYIWKLIKQGSPD